MSRKRWAAVAAAVVAVVAVAVGASLLANRARPAAQPSRESFGFDASYADPDPRVLLVRYGDSGSCPSEAVRHSVLQQPDRIVVTLTRSRMKADPPCTADYKIMLVRISLAAPLDRRVVIDGSRQMPVPTSSGTPPFG